ncbi:Hypothetical protein A7982_04013 [Minicystis rosea]|nr:Hypothetical protein A7982_04013 [Minicystis rosea]
MNPYRKGTPRLDLSPTDRAASYRAARVRLVVAAGSLVAAGIVIPLAGRSCRPAVAPMEVPPELLRAGATFPAAIPDLRPATPLDPLLAADAPDRLAVLEPTANAINLRPGAPLVVRFNRPMVEGVRVGKPADEAVIALTPPVRGQTRWTSRNTVSFEAEPGTWSNTRTVSMDLAPMLRSLAGETIEDFQARTVVFDGGPRFDHARHASRLVPGEPLTLLFSGKIDAALLPSQMMVYEIDGGRRMLPFSALERPRDKQGLVPVEVSLKKSLEAGAHFAVALAPPITWGGSEPRVVRFQIATRPRIDGIDCQESATEGSACAHSGPPGQIVDIGEVLRLLATEELAALPKDAVQVKPALAGLAVKIEDKKKIVISGDWDPGQVYEVRVGGLRDTEGRDLERLAPLAIRSAGRTPEVRAKSGRLAFEQEAKAALDIAAIHVEEGEARIGAVPPGQEIEAALFPARWIGPERTGQWRSMKLTEVVPSSRPNRWGSGSLSWMDQDPDNAALAVISLLPDKSERRPEALPATFVQRTDLGIDAKLLPRGVLAWVTSVHRAEPVAGSRVTVADATGTTLAEASTDGNGVAWIPLEQNLLEAGGAVRAVAGKDRAVLVMDPRAAMGPRHLRISPGEAPPPADAWVATVFTDRGICRPGETIHAKAVVREGSGDALTAPLGAVRVMLFGPAGEAPKAERVVALSSFGSVDADFAVDAGADPGTYRVEVRRDGQERPVGSASFAVGQYQLPAFRVDLALSEAVLVDRDPMHANVAVNYMFGPPAAGTRLSWTLQRSGSSDYPDKWATYAFTPVDASAHFGTMAQGDMTLDAEGRAAIGTTVSLGAPVREEATLEVMVRDITGSVTSARRHFQMRPATYEVGVRRAAQWIEHGAELNAETIVIDGDGALVPGRKVEARIVREGWHTYWEWSRHGAADEEEGEGGSYETRRTRSREVVHRCNVTSAAAPVSCAWKAERPGTYVLEAVTRDDRGRTSTASQRVYVAGPDEHPDRDPPGTAVTLTPERSAYEVGQTAEIAFESPFPEGEALLTVERDGVIVMEQRRVKAGGDVYRFPVTAEMVPNAFVSLTLVRPRTGAPGKKIDLDAPDLRVGLTEIAVRPAASPLTVSIEAGPSAPAGSDVPIAVAVRDAGGQGVPAEVALFAVDEGTLRITGYEVPDALSGLFRRMPPSFAWEDLRRALVSRVDEPLVPSAGGDGSEAGSARRTPEQDRFEPTPLWLPRLTTDAEGRASATIHLPSRPTQYRIMAVAVDAGTRAGHAHHTMVAAMPVVVRPALPDAATVGDHFEAAAIVHNTEDKPVDVTVTPIVDGVPRSPQVLHLEPRAQSRVVEWVDVARADDLVVRFEARAEGASTLAEARVAVAPRGRTARSEAVGAVSGSRDLKVQLPATVEAGTVTLSIASHPFVGLDASFESLLASPEAGAEVTASSVIALAAYATFDLGRKPGGVSTEEIRARAASAIARLTSLQQHSGGFGAFSAGSPVDVYLSVYALHALSAARRAGHKVPDDALDRARSYVHGEVRDTVFGDRDTGGHDEMAFALRVLTEAHEPDVDRIRAVYDQRERLSPYGMAQLALAMDDMDRRRDTLVLEAIQRVLATREDERQNPRILRWYDGSARTLGAVLEAALAIDVGRKDAGRLATRLLAARDEARGGFGSTHETSHALAALAAYAATVRAEGPFTPRVLLDGAPLTAGARTSMLAWYTIPAAQVMGKEHTLRIEAPGTAWFAIASRCVEPLGPLDEVARGEAAALHRVLEDASGKPLGAHARVRLGELVRVRLFLHSEHATPPYLALRDRMAGGLSPIDGAHETTPRASLWALLGMGADDDAVDSRGHWAARSLDAISHRAFSAGRATFYMTQPGSGLREITYGARATTVGTFVLPPAEIEALYAPSFVARSAVNTLTVDP